MAITAIGTAMLEVLHKENMPAVMWGDCQLLEEAFYTSGSKSVWAKRHPLNVFQYVLNTLERDSRFIKGYVQIDLFPSGQTRFVRAFSVKDTD